jgi:hypothetical protein
LDITWRELKPAADRRFLSLLAAAGSYVELAGANDAFAEHGLC